MRDSTKVLELSCLIQENNKDKFYITKKLIEEMSELSTVLLQCTNKPEEVTDEQLQNILEEVADVELRLSIYKCVHLTPKEHKVVKKRIDMKLEKYKNKLGRKDNI